MTKTILSGLVLLLLAGCTQPATTTNTSNTTTTNTAVTTAPGGPLKEEAFNHATLPDSVENMSGTASYAEIVELTTASGKGTTFLLLSSTDPTKGVLIVTAEGKPEDISKKPAGVIKVSGPVKEIEHGNVTATTKSGANLANKAGKIQYVEAVSIDWGAPAGDATGAPGTPSAGETPAPAGTETPAPDATGTPAETPAGDAATPGAETPPATPAETPTP